MEEIEAATCSDSSDAAGEDMLVSEKPIPLDKPEVESSSEIQLALSENVSIAGGGQITLIPPFGCSVQATIMSGDCQMFGATLTAGTGYNFTYPQRAVLASFSGCCVFLRKTGYIEPSNVIIADQFPHMVGWVHALLDAQRVLAENSQGAMQGPKIMVVGPLDSAKSSMCRTLLQYAVAMGWQPTFVDLDAGQQGISLPGIFSMAVMSGSRETTPERDGMLYRYDLPLGKIRMDEDVVLVKHQAEALAEEVQRSLSRSRYLDASGVVINTAGWINDDGFVSLTQFAQAFQVNMVLVMDDSALGHRFQKWIAQAKLDIEVLFCKKPIGLTLRTIEARRDYRDHMVKSAFCRPNTPPGFTIIPLNKLVFYQLASFHSIRLGNGKRIAICNQVCGPDTNLKRVLAISSATTLESDVKAFPILGFAVLLRFSTPANQAWIISTIDLNRLRGPVILLRTEVSAAVIRNLFSQSDLYPDSANAT